MDMFSTRNVPGAAFPYESMSFPPQFEAPSPEELHELLPAYDVLAFIAKGGMGAVYKAHQKSLERDVAIKILPREFGADEDFRKRFEDEAKAMAKLNHPNIVGALDVGIETREVELAANDADQRRRVVHDRLAPIGARSEVV